MKYEQITARGLLERLDQYPTLELRTRDGWCVVTYISNHKAQNAVVIPTSNQIYVTAVHQLVYRPMDILNIRYDEVIDDDQDELVNPIAEDATVKPRYFIYKDEPEGYRFEAGDDEVIDDDQDDEDQNDLVRLSANDVATMKEDIRESLGIKLNKGFLHRFFSDLASDES